MIHSLLDNKETDKAKKMADRIKGNIDRFYKNYNAPTDHKILAAMFKLYATDVPAEFQPDIYNLIHKFPGRILKCEEGTIIDSGDQLN